MFFLSHNFPKILTASKTLRKKHSNVFPHNFPIHVTFVPSSTAHQECKMTLLFKSLILCLLNQLNPPLKLLLKLFQRLFSVFLLSNQLSPPAALNLTLICGASTHCVLYTTKYSFQISPKYSHFYLFL